MYACVYVSIWLSSVGEGLRKKCKSLLKSRPRVVKPCSSVLEVDQQAWLHLSETFFLLRSASLLITHTGRRAGTLTAENEGLNTNIDYFEIEVRRCWKPNPRHESPSDRPEWGVGRGLWKPRSRDEEAEHAQEMASFSPLSRQRMHLTWPNITHSISEPPKTYLAQSH